MEEKRISLRFRANQAMEQKAWEKLEQLSAEKNISKNALIVEMICNYSSRQIMQDEDMLAGKIADCVVDQLRPYITTAITDVTASRADSTMKAVGNVEEPPRVDEIDEIDPGALEFLAGL